MTIPPLCHLRCIEFRPNGVDQVLKDCPTSHAYGAQRLLPSAGDTLGRTDDQASFTSILARRDESVEGVPTEPFAGIVTVPGTTHGASPGGETLSADGSDKPACSQETNSVAGTGRFCHPREAVKTLIRRGKEETLRSTRPTSTSTRGDARGPVTQSVRKAVTRLNEDQVSQLVLEYLDGDLVSVLAARYGIHRVTVNEHLRRRNVPARVKGLLPPQAAECAALHEEGYSLASIGKHYGVTANTIRTVLLQSGTRLRGPNELQHGAVPST